MSQNDIKLCICEDDPLYQRSLDVWLSDSFQLTFTQSGEELMEAAHATRPDVILLDLRINNENRGFDILKRAKATWPDLPVVIHSGMADYQSVVRAMRLGAADYIPKHSTCDKVKSQLRQIALQRRRLAQQPVQGAHMVGQSPALETLRKTLRRIRDFPGNVIIIGESGVGKELVANALKREDAPFVAVDASTIQSTTAESMLFGHERGAFTGADKVRRGLLEEADGGTIYFDEVANMSMDVQAKLLRALQEKVVLRLGGSQVRQLQFRVVSATNRDLDAMCRAGEFRADLLARLNVFVLHVPPLRERPTDIPALVQHFIERYAPGTALPEIDAAVMDRLVAHDWPGNVRELSNTVQYLLAMSEGQRIDVEHLPAKIATDTPPGISGHAAAQQEFTEGGYQDRLRAFERTMLAREYAAADGNVSRMARNLRMDRSNLHAKLLDYQIHAVAPKPRGKRL